MTNTTNKLQNPRHVYRLLWYVTQPPHSPSLKPSTLITLTFTVTGANRGIGLALVTALSSNPSAIVFAGARDPSSATELLKLEKEKKNLHVVKISSGNVEDNEAAVKVIEEKVGKIDVVIANAGELCGLAFLPFSTKNVNKSQIDQNHPGIGGTATPIIKTSGSSLLNHVNVNVVGPLILFQSVFPLLTKSTLPTGGKFSIISSLLGSISLQPGEFMSGEYSISKVGANMLIKRIQLEHPDVVALALQ